MKRIILCCSAAALLIFGLTLAAEVKMPSFFSDNMVLQSGVSVNIWGNADPGENVSVAFKGQHKKNVAGSDGRWKLVLDPLQASAESAEMTISGKNIIKISNVIAGDVWMASGQSNMEMKVKDCVNFEEEKRNADFPAMRFFRVGKQISAKPLENLEGKWVVSSVGSAGSFSAVAFFFGRELYLKHKTPLGFIDNSWAGSVCEAWVPQETLLADGKLPQPLKISPEKMADIKTYSDYAESVYKANLNKDPGVAPESADWSKTEFNDSNWKEMSIPASWESNGLNADGAVWFRKTVDIPESWNGSDLILVLFACDNDITYFNGAKVGATERKSYLNRTLTRSYKISKDIVKPGKNVVAVRVFNGIGIGGIYGYRIDLRIQKSSSEKISLAGKWKYNVELKLEPAKMPMDFPSPKDIPAAAYNAMVAPFENYNITGAIWYQGEQNADAAMQYRKLFSDMIIAWRAKFNNPEMPFLFVQLANYRKRQKQPSEGGWAEIRESQALALKLPKTGMAVTTDIGDPLDIHPKNKKDFGLRLALWAERYRYGNNDIEVSGPLYDSMKIEGSKIIIAFTHAMGGLKSKDGELKGFAIAGEDKKFVWAKAEIKGSDIVVWSNEIKKPAAVRYAWATNPEGNLYNGKGLPASSFRTDMP